MHPPTSRYPWPRRSLGVLALALATLGILGCPAHLQPNRQIVREVNLRGTRSTSSGELQDHLATRETSYFPATHPSWLRWWRWWWVEPEYLDDAALQRDRLRIRRFLQARGFYDATVSEPDVQALGGDQVRVQVDIREGPPTLVAGIRLHGCGPGDDPALPADTCETIRGRFQLSPGQRFDEARFGHDRLQVRDFTREAGHPTPVVVPRATIDPERHLAWVDYTVLPGPRGRFGGVRLFVVPGTTPVTGPTLPNGLPVRVIRSSLSIQPGQPYSVSALAAAQRALFDLGVFGIARIEERPRAGGVVDLDVRLSTGPLTRVRLGGGLEGDTSRLAVHGLAGFEHRNFLGDFRRLRLEARPLLFLTPEIQPGVRVLTELQQPELLKHTTGVLSAGFDLGPDPINPGLTWRRTFQGAVGLEHRMSANLLSTLYLRGTAATYFNTDPLLSRDPLFRQQYFDQFSAYVTPSIVWDRRDDRTHTRSGAYLAASLDGGLYGALEEGLPGAAAIFVRARGEARGYVPLTRNLVLAARGILGAIAGVDVNENRGRVLWPVPQDLRFYSGGAQSNRGAPFNRVGALSTVPLSAGPGVGYLLDREGLPMIDPDRITALGGVGIWEASLELRLTLGALGLVAFFDVSNVSGVDPSYIARPASQASAPCDDPERGTVPDAIECPLRPPPPPRPGFSDLFRRANPAVGVGLRYSTPIGPIRLDFGVRLSDLTCSEVPDQVRQQNLNSANQRPWYYVVTSPHCSLFGLTTPAVLHFAIGEAY